MLELWTHPLTIRALQAAAMLRAFLRYRNPRRIRSGEYLAEFHDRIWRESAGEIGAVFTPIGAEIGEVARGAARTRVWMNVSAIDDPVTLALVHDKSLTHRILRDAGLPVPEHLPFTLNNLKRAETFLKNGAPCVVKPASGTGGGRGVTTGITRAAHLARASAAAGVYADELLIERQIEGENYRLLYLDGELIDAFVRKLPAVIGDGRSTIARLVRQANDERLKNRTELSQVLLSIDQDMRRTLARQGLKLRSVPHAGQRVTLKTVVNENGARDNTTAARLCPRIVEEGARAVRALRLRFGGVDVITTDPGVPLAESGGVILEVNGTPNLYFHYHKADGPVPVASILLEKLLSEREAGSASEETWNLPALAHAEDS